MNRTTKGEYENYKFMLDGGPNTNISLYVNIYGLILLRDLKKVQRKRTYEKEVTKVIFF